MTKQRHTLTFTDAKGQIILQEKRRRAFIEKFYCSRRTGLFGRTTFLITADEYLFGTGQFQDGYLNVRGLSRRLTQVNTQIAIPFILSNKGYGIFVEQLWSDRL